LSASGAALTVLLLRCRPDSSAARAAWADEAAFCEALSEAWVVLSWACR
jgi:hypothetical protein